jgi:hypothetical protein
MNTGGYNFKSYHAGKAFERPNLETFTNELQIGKWAMQIGAQLDAPSNPAKGDMSQHHLQVVCFLIASSVIGADEHRIAKILGIDPRMAAFWAGNLRESGLWLPDGRILNDHWFREDGGRVVFLFDSLVASGHLRRESHPYSSLPAYNLVPQRPHEELN